MKKLIYIGGGIVVVLLAAAIILEIVGLILVRRIASVAY